MKENRAKIGLRSVDRGVIYEGFHSSTKNAVNDAIHNNIDLKGIDLSGQDLRGITLDGINLRNANFKGSDLTDANLSEAAFHDCDFSQARLFEACFCYSDLNNCLFLDTNFGMTDFSEAKLMDCHFSGDSTFSLNLSAAYSLAGSVYEHDDEKIKMSKPPYILQGFKNPLVFLDHKILIDGTVYDYGWEELSDFSERLLLQLLSRHSSAG